MPYRQRLTVGLARSIEDGKYELLILKGGRSPRTHVREIHRTNPSKNNNIVERLKGTVRGRHKDVRGLKNCGLMSAQKAALDVPSDENRWLALFITEAPVAVEG